MLVIKLWIHTALWYLLSTARAAWNNCPS